MPLLPTLSIFLVLAFILFLPGYCLSHIFYHFDEIDWLERLGISFAISLSLIPLCLYFLGLLGIGITILSVFVTVIVILLLSVVLLLFQEIHKKKERRG